MNFPLGISLLLVAALMNGNFALPMKYAKGWNWEIIWIVYTLLALVLMAWLISLKIAAEARKPVFEGSEQAQMDVQPASTGMFWPVT